MVWVWFDIRRTKYCLQKIIVKGSTLSLAIIAVIVGKHIQNNNCINWRFSSLDASKSTNKICCQYLWKQRSFFCWTLEYWTWQNRHQAVCHIMSLCHQTLVPSQYSSVPLLHLLTSAQYEDIRLRKSREQETQWMTGAVFEVSRIRTAVFFYCCNRWELPVQQPCYRIKRYYWANHIAKEAPLFIFLSLVFEDLNRFLYEVSLDHIREKQL